MIENFAPPFLVAQKADENEEEVDGRFISSENWEPIFADEASPTEISWIFDNRRRRIAVLHVRVFASGQWCRGHAPEVLDLEECLINSGQSFFEHLEEWGLVASNTMPSWALDATAADCFDLTEAVHDHAKR